MEKGVDDLGDLFENSRSENEEQENQTKKSADVDSVVPVKKRVLKNPRLKFNAERLCGERGIPILVDHFKNVKFKGKGYEKEDLNKLLATLEHWTHRLFPSMKFIQCLRQIEKLGRKRPVQTCLHKIRMDMPILSKDFVHDDEEDRPNESENNLDTDIQEIDPFDVLVGNNNRSNESNPYDSSSIQSVENHGSPDNSSLHSLSTSQTAGQALGSSFGSSLTEEQKKRMEYNRMLATERRKAKERLMQSNLSLASEDSAAVTSPQSTNGNLQNKSAKYSGSQNFIENSTSDSNLLESNANKLNLHTSDYKQNDPACTSHQNDIDSYTHSNSSLAAKNLLSVLDNNAVKLTSNAEHSEIDNIKLDEVMEVDNISPNNSFAEKENNVLQNMVKSQDLNDFTGLNLVECKKLEPLKCSKDNTTNEYLEVNNLDFAGIDSSITNNAGGTNEQAMNSNSKSDIQISHCSDIPEELELDEMMDLIDE